MPKDPISRRRFLKSASTAAAAATLAGRFAFPETASAASDAVGGTTNGLHFGIQAPAQNVTYSALQETWLEADELGYDSAFGFDHFLPIMSDPPTASDDAWHWRWLV